MRPNKDQRLSANRKYPLVVAICISALPLLAISGLKWLGWILISFTALTAVSLYRTKFGRHMLILIGALALLGLVPISTGVSYTHMLLMGSALFAAVVLPLIITNRFFKEQTITLPFFVARKWYKREVAYVLFAGVGAYLIVPFYLWNTRSYLNWSVELDPSHILRLFVGTNVLGIWDELFFIGVCLALLRQHLPFILANIVQATLWTTFLYALGFRGWGPLLIFFFALSQGYIFKRTKSLLYIITVHLTIDFVLFLTLIHLHHPEHLRIFITSQI